MQLQHRFFSISNVRALAMWKFCRISVRHEILRTAARWLDCTVECLTAGAYACSRGIFIGVATWRVEAIELELGFKVESG